MTKRPASAQPELTPDTKQLPRPSDPTVDTLRREVDVLQVQIAEKRSPWKQVSTWLSALALFVSAASWLISYTSRNDALSKEARERHQAMLTELATMLGAGSTGNPVDTQIAVMHFQYAESLATDIKDKTSMEWLTLGMGCALSGDSVQAENDFKFALDASPRPIDKINLLRNLALFYFTAGPRQNLTAGRQRFEETNKASEGDASLVEQKIMTEAFWSFAEKNVGDEAQSQTHFLKAQKIISTRPAIDAQRFAQTTGSDCESTTHATPVTARCAVIECGGIVLIR